MRPESSKDSRRYIPQRRIVGVAAGNSNLAAGIGYYAAELSIYENFLHSDLDVVFPRNTASKSKPTLSVRRL